MAINNFDVEVEYVPYVKIIIHDIMAHTFDSYLKLIGPLGNLNPRWIDGVLFHFSGIEHKTTDMIEKQLSGTLHWDSFNFTKMPTYVDLLQDKITGRPISVIENDNNITVKGVINWLKKQDIFINQKQ